MKIYYILFIILFIPIIFGFIKNEQFLNEKCVNLWYQKYESVREQETAHCRTYNLDWTLKKEILVNF